MALVAVGGFVHHLNLEASQLVRLLLKHLSTKSALGTCSLIATEAER